MKPQLDATQKALTKKIRALVPDATAIIFHGSRVRGIPAPTSDYDVMVLTPRGMDFDKRRKVKTLVQRTIPNVKIDVAFGSERALIANLAVEPYYRFWMENGVASFGQIPHVESYPPFYKDAIDSHLRILRARINVTEVCSQTEAQKAMGYLQILKLLVLIELAMQGEYRNEVLWAQVERLIGATRLTYLRGLGANQRVRKKTSLELRRLVERKLATVRRKLRAANLPYKYASGNESR